MKRKQIACLLLAGMVTASGIPGGMTAWAATNSSAATEDADPVSTAGPQECTVEAEVASSFSVTIPKKITLDGSTKSGTYTVGCTGDFAGNEFVSVTPDASFNMTQDSKADVTATVTQAKTSFRAPGYQGALTDTEVKMNAADSDPATTEGNIAADGLSAGKWSGKFNFTIAQDSYGEDATLTKDNLTTYNVAATGDVVIPASVTDPDGTIHAVTAIGAEAFKDNTNVTSVTIPASVKTIGAGAFNGATALASVTYNGKICTNSSSLMSAMSEDGCTAASDAFDNTALTNPIYLTEGQTYTFGGYNWTAAEVDNVNHTAVLQSQGVTGGAWPGYKMTKFGNGSNYGSSIDGQDISEYDTKTKTLYDSIKSVENTSADYGSGLFLVSAEKCNQTKDGKQGSGNYWNAAKTAATNYSSFGAFSGSSWLGIVSSSGPFAYYVISNGNIGNVGPAQSSSFVIAPAFNIDLTKVTLSDGNTLTVK